MPLQKGERQKKELEGRGEAAAILAKGEAEARVIELKLLAEAKGVLQKAEAYKQLNEAGKLLQILEAAKEIIPMGLEKLAPVMGEIAKDLGNIDRISIVNIGGDGNSGGGLGKFAKIAPTVLFQFFEGLKALGLDPSDLEKLIKVKPVTDTGSDKEKPPEAHK